MDNSFNNSQSNEMSVLDKITLECLMNENSYEKYLIQKSNITIEKKVSELAEKRFYRKRIVNITKELLKKNNNVNVNDVLKHSFQEYIKNCIEYFKDEDRTDALQQQHGIIQKAETSNVNRSIYPIKEENDKNIDKVMFNKRTKPKKITDFINIKKKSLVEKKEVPIPKQMNINLKDPKLRKKGLRKNKEKK